MQQLMPNTELFESVCEDKDARHYVGDQEAKQKAAGQKGIVAKTREFASAGPLAKIASVRSSTQIARR
jgi:hypothetical protein